MSNHIPSRITYPLIRKFHWALVLACFFLPCVRGCNDEIVFPYREIVSTPNCTVSDIDWTMLFMFLYPLLFAVVAWLMTRVLKASWRFRVLWILLYAMALGVTYVVAELIKDPSWRDAGVLGSSLILIWGTVFLGLARIKDLAGLIDLLGFTLSAFALWLFPLGFLFAHEIMIGGWIFIYANGIVLVTYALPLAAKGIEQRAKSTVAPGSP